MAIINCAECSREISSMAKACPYCGMPVKYKNNTKKSGSGGSSIISITSLGFSILAMIIAISSSPDMTGVAEETGQNISDSIEASQESETEAAEEENIENKEKKEKEEEKEEKTYSFQGDSDRDFQVTTVADDSFRLSENTGKVTVVNFWASWCGYCMDEMSDLNKLQNKYGDEVTVLAINSGESKSEVDSYVGGQDYSMTFAYDEDDQVSSSYGIEYLPQTYVFDREGKLVEEFEGAYSYSDFKAAVDEAMQE